ncbi:dienelactone hydrolase family protein [Azospirillum sp. ST 5-10]|uniref:dienelactone hydrolase family protein n=1 Tax=unclassified Azospirillum TaxID=2630922 RepID=UPI003F49D720
MPGRRPRPDPFDERGQLRGDWTARIRRRLDGGGGEPLEEQCRRLSGTVGVRWEALWALLMWNTGVSAGAADRLRRWIVQGMPLEPPVARPGRRARRPATPPQDRAAGPGGDAMHPSRGDRETAGLIALPLGMEGTLSVPTDAAGIVLFAHGSGSSRFSPRNRVVAAGLNAAGFGTLLFDLLSRDEEESRATVFDVDLLAERLALITAWLAQRDGAGRPLGYFGASTGAAAALVASTMAGPDITAIVSRGGRPDLAGDALPLVTAPTLLIVGGADEVVLDLNEDAARRLRCPHELRVVPGATHLFEEPGALDAVTALAVAWYRRHLAPPAARPR